ncbi:conjugal transfer protein TraG, partial [Paraburkholderia sp. UCT31]|uniref:conjugal transfer protein TraG N-terminal domain-containing protein n=1 Tax=Paraburkholderia sp. UCT31 TaxID=2615209 RepID=UPI00165605AA
MRNLKKLLVGAALASAPLAVMAAPGMLNPTGSTNAWDMYVMGNGAAIAQILTAITLVVTSSAFKMLMLFMAVCGFLVMAVQAGFDAGKNLVKMFTYILIVWAVTLTTTGIRANIHIIDPVTAYDSVVPNVPALVGVPAAIVSDVGHELTYRMEQGFSTPSQFSLTGGGFYNIFGQLMKDSNEIHITNSNLKMSLDAFISDCAVPAMAQGSLSLDALTTSTNLWSTLSAAKLNAVLTKYFPYDNGAALGGVSSGTAVLNAACASAGGGGIAQEGGMGATVSCATAYTCLDSDLKRHASMLLNSSANSWATTGVNTPMATLMTTAIQWAGGGMNSDATGIDPAGYFQQKALLSSMTGAFRQAAVQAGNNELMTAALVTQAEQNQKSTWVVGAQIFQNSMGYIYTVLQAFIFGLVPIVIVALMIPGLGREIFANFAQLLVWMALWMPMFAIINYLILLFAGQNFATVWNGGPSMQNQYAVSEMTNNLVIAAQFLGTMVPLLAWGVVKGGLAFTDFISHGIGNSFAAGAGSGAANGSFQTGSVSTGNVSGGKYDTASTASVGAKATNSFEGVGSALTSNDRGGSTAQGDGGSLNASVSTDDSHKTSMGHNLSASDNFSGDRRKTAGTSVGHDSGNQINSSGTLSQSRATKEGTGSNAQTGQNTQKDQSTNAEASRNKSTSNTDQRSDAAELSGGASMGSGLKGAGGGAG